MKKHECKEEVVGKDHSKNSLGGVKRLAAWRISAMKIGGFTKPMKKKLSFEASSYFESGTCSPLAAETYGINPTLFEPKTFDWRVDVTSCPFDTYLPLDLKDLETSAKEGIATGFCQKILKNLVAEYRRKKQDIDFHLYLSDDWNSSLSDIEEKFDVIDCSTLADEVGLANLIVLASQKLEPHLHALLITESFQWGTVASTVELYLEESLCAPLSMIPTIYGLRVANHVELGRTTFIEVDYPSGYPPVTLCWRQAPRFKNVKLSYSCAVGVFRDRLASKCFFKEDACNLKEGENCGLKCYTPLTYSSIVTNLAEVMNVEINQPEIESQFALALKTVKDWAAGRPINIVMATLPFTPIVDQFLQCQTMPDASWMRLILVPSELFASYKKKKRKFKVNWAFEIPQTHYIDNFCLHCNKNETGSIISMQVSFLLPKKHGLSDTHCGVIVDLLTGRTLVVIGDIKDMQQQRHSIPHPSSKHLRPSIESASKKNLLKVTECAESVFSFLINVSVVGNEPFKGSFSFFY